jgi:hypothetical protein
MLLACCLGLALIRNGLVGQEEDGHVQHSEQL